MRLATICNHCHTGRYRAARTITKGSSRIRYLKCSFCGATSKEVLRIDPSTGRPIESSFHAASSTAGKLGFREGENCE
jgi:hypothetical protein